MNELRIFEGKEVEVLEIEGNALFNPRHVGECLELSEDAIRKQMQRMSEKQITKLKNSDFPDGSIRKLNNTGENFLTEEGLCLLLTKTTNVSFNKKQDFILELNKQGYNLNLVALTRKEIEFLDLLECVLEPFNYTCYKQYNVNGKRIDFYIEDLNIAIEYDEGNHSNYSYENQEERQKMIEKELGCKFIRLSDEESNAYNVGLVMKRMVK